MNNQMQTAQKPQKARFSVAITTPQYQQMINSTLSDPNRVRTFVAAITSAVAVNPALQECTPQTILAGALLGESLNLSPSPQLGQYYLVPFDKKVKLPDGSWGKEKNATFVLGYRGLLQLAIRSGYYLDIDAMEVHEGEYKGKDKFSGKPIFEFIEDDTKRDALPVIGYMAYFEYLNGFKKVLYWSKEKMLQHADTYSAAFSAADYAKLQRNEIPRDEMWKYSSQWYKNFGDMSKKTMIRQLISKWGVMSTEMSRGYESDSYSIKAEDGNLVPDITPDPDPVSAEQEQAPEAQEPPKAAPQKISMSDV